MVSQLIQDFFARYPTRQFSKGQIIVHAGEDPLGVLYLVEGRISQYDIAPSGNKVVVNVFKPGAFWPMSWAINRTPNQFFFEASTKVTAHQAPAQEVLAFLHQQPDVVFDLLSRVYRGVDGLLRRNAHMMGGDARSRLVFEIITAAYRFGKQDAAEVWHVPLKEGELATQSGLARETVNRVVRHLKAEGLVAVTASGLTVPDMAKLQAVLGQDL